MNKAGSIEFVNKAVDDAESKEVTAKIGELLGSTYDILMCQCCTERLLAVIYRQFPIPAGAEKRHSISLDDIGQLMIHIQHKGRTWEVLVSH